MKKNYTLFWAILCFATSSFGQEQLINPTFDTNLNGWTTSGNIIHANGCVGVAIFNASGTTPNGILSQDFVSIASQNYTVSIDHNGHNNTQIALLEIIDNTNSNVLLSQSLTAVQECTNGYENFTAVYAATSTDTKIRLTDVSTTSGGADLHLGTASIVFGGVLPVELVSFKAQHKNQSVNLTWQTASELNNMGFDIERSSEGTDWEMINFVEGNGSTNASQFYYFMDTRPLVGYNYYRLKQMDYDGKYKYSNILSVVIDDLKQADLQVFPNPNNGQFTLSLLKPQHSDASIRIYGTEGNLIIEEYVSSSEELTHWKKELDLPRGKMYHVVTYVDGKVITKKVMSMNRK